MRLVPLLCVMLVSLWSAPAGAGDKSVTLYLDGARVEHETKAARGYLEYPLPDALTPGTFRVKPVGRGSVLRVEFVPAARDRRNAREIAKLEERKSELQDKMQALSRREEIFSAAARSQSGKAPRKTKANPDPVSSLQQGTDFALAQLDSVNRSQRNCRRALDELETKLSAARKGRAVARIWLSAKRARVSYRVEDRRWTPCYDLRWSGDSTGELLLHAKLPRPEKGISYRLSQGTLAQGLTSRPVHDEFPTLSRHPLTLQGAGTENPPLTFKFAPVQAGLPPGEAAAYWRGEYIGSGPFSGAGASEFAVATGAAPGKPAGGSGDAVY